MHLATRAHMSSFGMRPMHRNKGSPKPERPEPAICNCLALRQAARHATALYERHLAPTGLTSPQYSILAKLTRLGPQSINALAAMMVMDRTTTTRAVRPLARDKLVAVSPGEDERTRIVRITPTGEKRVKAAAVHWRAAQKEFEKGYGSDAAARLREDLARVVEAV